MLYYHIVLLSHYSKEWPSSHREWVELVRKQVESHDLETERLGSWCVYVAGHGPVNIEVYALVLYQYNIATDICRHQNSGLGALSFHCHSIGMFFSTRNKPPVSQIASSVLKQVSTPTMCTCLCLCIYVYLSVRMSGCVICW